MFQPEEISTALPIIIFRNLVHDEEYCRTVIPFIKSEYFREDSQSLVFDEISKFFLEYNALPSKEALFIQLSRRKEIKNQSTALEVSSLVRDMFKQHIDEDNILERNNSINQEWLLQETEKFCQQQAVYNAVINSINIITGKDEESPHIIPEILQKALNVSFSTHVGHDYIEEAEERFEYYHRKENRIEFDIDILNEITNGGIPPKTLNLFLLETGGGKTLILCHLASSFYLSGKNVLYITLEMAQEKIASRIDANTFNLSLQSIPQLEHDTFKGKIEKLRSKSNGRLIVKEYPTGAAHTGHFRALISELKTKKKFIPDVIIVDYLGICASSRVKTLSGSINSFTYLKFIAEELRGLAIENNLPIFSGIQTNRGGTSNSDLSLGETAESIGIAYTADLILAGYSNEEMKETGKMLMKQLKNRYGDLNWKNKFMIGAERSKMRLYNLVDPEDMGIKQNSTSQIGYEMNEKILNAPHKNALDFSGITV
jgi:archaellum biogenesis ATPase FlaH